MLKVQSKVPTFIEMALHTAKYRMDLQQETLGAAMINALMLVRIIRISPRMGATIQKKKEEERGPNMGSTGTESQSEELMMPTTFFSQWEKSW